MGLLTKIFGTYSDHELKKIYPIADKIEALHAVGIDVADTVAHIGETVVKTLKEHGLYDKCHTC